MKKCNITICPEHVQKTLRMIKSKEKIFSNILHNFLLKKIENFFGVNSNLTVQKMVQYFYILSVLRYGHVKYLSNKRNQSSLSFLWPKIFGRKSTKIFVARVILNAPTVCETRIRIPLLAVSRYTFHIKPSGKD
jgi:hypothetical protein